ncbi:hypothetical protein CHS0354_037336 [Potamilus streckersoni]|uniref:Uncharacterized protein n=1 Tax=Potamilus streckersoni TaxID=2493646 RepID=A0AAE0WEJ1_9BIVA|nr:hypothetical protein CHS0354_037336 [Potamilus streckersoni]
MPLYICYRDHPDYKEGCNRVKLRYLITLKPKNFRERVGRALVRGSIGTKHKLNIGIPGKIKNSAVIEDLSKLAEELDKHKHFPRRRVITFATDDISSAKLVDMREQSVQRSFQIVYTVHRCVQQIKFDSILGDTSGTGKPNKL